MEMVNFLYLVDDAAWGAPATAGALREAVELLLHMLSPSLRTSRRSCGSVWGTPT